DTFGLHKAVDREIDSQGVRGIIFPLDNCEVELLQPTREGTGIARFLETNGEGFHHLCFGTTDVATELKTAEAKGMNMIDTEPREGLSGMIGFIHPRSNHGVLIELAEPPSGAPVHNGPAEGPYPHAMHHITVAVHEIAPVVDEWTERFGLSIGRHAASEALGIEAQFLSLGGTEIELVRPLEGSGGPLPRKLEHGEGLFMLALTVRDAEQSVGYLRTRGLTVTDANTGAFISPKHTYGARLRLSEA
ncbi:MAG: VOC family protein, partial [Chloroflexi bacterium]|nr:VOC family protein [Chloroflexota bacterium]